MQLQNSSLEVPRRRVASFAVLLGVQSLSSLAAAARSTAKESVPPLTLPPGLPSLKVLPIPPSSLSSAPTLLPLKRSLLYSPNMTPSSSSMIPAAWRGPLASSRRLTGLRSRISSMTSLASVPSGTATESTSASSTR